jgi:hypothetical protein
MAERAPVKAGAKNESSEKKLLKNSEGTFFWSGKLPGKFLGS